jgi:DNA-binding FadR family transcriptional regulator
MIDHPDEANAAGDDEERHGGRPRGSTQDTLDRLGRKIVEGAPGYRPGDGLRVDSVVADLHVTKAMAREVLQALHQMRLIKIQPRVGATVQELQHWDMLEPTVIQWRLAQPSPRLQRSLAELRAAIEPAAARLAATRAPAAVCYDLLNLARQLYEIGNRKSFDDLARESYRDVDARFHTAVLTASDNEAFRSLAHAVTLAMNHRIDRQWAGGKRRQASRRATTRGAGGFRDFPERPERVSLWFHLFLAQAIVQAQPKAAGAFSEGLLAEVDGDLLTDADLRESVLHGLDDIELDDTERAEFKSELDDALAKVRATRRAETGQEK